MLKIAKDLFDLLYPVGTYYETSNANWTPSSAGWYGTWVEDTGGKTLVAKDNGTFKTLGADVGAESKSVSNTHKHQATGDNLYALIGSPTGNANAIGFTSTGWKSRTNSTYSVGNSSSATTNGHPGRSHDTPVRGNTNDETITITTNVIQPSKVCRRWHRTA